jgi:hypothetical protein
VASLYDLFAHNWAASVGVETTWLDAITTSTTTGQEERVTLVERPRRRLEFTWRALSRAQAQRMHFALFRAANDELRVPIYCDQAITTASSSGTTVNAPTANRRLFVGSRFALVAADGTFQERIIDSLTSSTITPTVALTGTVAAGARVFPLIDAQVVLDSVKAWETNEGGSVSAVFLEVTDSRTLPSAAADTLPTDVSEATLAPAAALPIYPEAPNWAGGVSLGPIRQGRNFGRGRANRVVTEGTRPLAALSFEVLVRTRAKAWRLIQFFDYVRGRCFPFWVLSPVAILEAAAFATTHVDVVQAGNLADLEDFLHHVAIVKSDGSFELARVSTVTVAGSYWRITFAASISSVATAVSVSAAFLMRFASTAQKEEWVTDEVCRFRPSFVEVQGHDELLDVTYA